MPVTDFLSEDAQVVVQSTVDVLRERLVQMAMGLGVELPVYVVWLWGVHDGDGRVRRRHSQ